MATFVIELEDEDELEADGVMRVLQAGGFEVQSVTEVTPAWGGGCDADLQFDYK